MVRSISLREIRTEVLETRLVTVGLEKLDRVIAPRPRFLNDARGHPVKHQTHGFRSGHGHHRDIAVEILGGIHSVLPEGRIGTIRQRAVIAAGLMDGRARQRGLEAAGAGDLGARSNQDFQAFLGLYPGPAAMAPAGTHQERHAQSQPIAFLGRVVHHSKPFLAEASHLARVIAIPPLRYAGQLIRHLHDQDASDTGLLQGFQVLGNACLAD
jgi:hypothetical protein